MIELMIEPWNGRGEETIVKRLKQPFRDHIWDLYHRYIDKFQNLRKECGGWLKPFLFYEGLIACDRGFDWAYTRPTLVKISQEEYDCADDELEQEPKLEATISLGEMLAKLGQTKRALKVLSCILLLGDITNLLASMHRYWACLC